MYLRNQKKLNTFFVSYIFNNKISHLFCVLKVLKATDFAASEDQRKKAKDCLLFSCFQQNWFKKFFSCTTRFIITYRSQCIVHQITIGNYESESSQTPFLLANENTWEV